MSLNLPHPLHFLKSLADFLFLSKWLTLIMQVVLHDRLAVQTLADHLTPEDLSVTPSVHGGRRELSENQPLLSSI